MDRAGAGRAPGARIGSDHGRGTCGRADASSPLLTNRQSYGLTALVRCKLVSARGEAPRLRACKLSAELAALFGLVWFATKRALGADSRPRFAAGRGPAPCLPPVLALLRVGRSGPRPRGPVSDGPGGGGGPEAAHRRKHWPATYGLSETRSHWLGPGGACAASYEPAGGGGAQKWSAGIEKESAAPGASRR